MGVISECALKTNTSDSVIYDPHILEKTPSESVMCMAKCILETLQIVDTDGRIVITVLKQYIQPLYYRLRVLVAICGEEIKTITKCYDMETYRKCVNTRLNPSPN